jgi:hypothetical protein
MAKGPTRLRFKADIDDWVKETQARLDAVFKAASQSVIEEVVARTPVDTGFLRASLTASLDSMEPIRRGSRPAGDAAPGSYPPPDVALVILSARVGQTIYASFTAEYSGVVEYGDGENRKPVGMVRLSAQNWPKHVRDAVRAARAAVRQSRSKRPAGSTE